MSDLRERLERRAAGIEPSEGALQTVLALARRRRQRRRVASSVIAAVTALVAFATLGNPVIAPKPAVAFGPIRIGPAPPQAVALRQQLGIQGSTKGTPDSIVIRYRDATGAEKIVAVRVRTGQVIDLPADATDATVAPGSSTVAVVSDNKVVVVGPGAPTPATRVVSPAQGSGGSLSWDRAGSALFARVNGQWVRAANPAPGAAPVGPSTTTLVVPKLPGGPSFLSVSPDGATVLMFGITTTDGSVAPSAAPPGSVGRNPDLTGSPSARPHVFIGDFDGSTVTNVRRIDIPSTALGGPLGWVGDNAFLIAPARGEALIVRVDGAPAVHVAPDPAVDACTAAPTRIECSSSSPVLLGTNADGSLLYWSDVASWTTPGGRAVVRHGYFQTWLDGAHGTRLTGAAGRYGPPLAGK